MLLPRGRYHRPAHRLRAPPFRPFVVGALLGVLDAGHSSASSLPRPRRNNPAVSLASSLIYISRGSPSSVKSRPPRFRPDVPLTFCEEHVGPGYALFRLLLEMIARNRRVVSRHPDARFSLVARANCRCSVSLYLTSAQCPIVRDGDKWPRGNRVVIFETRALFITRALIFPSLTLHAFLPGESTRRGRFVRWPLSRELPPVRALNRDGIY